MSEEEHLQKVFLYGTLKKGQPYEYLIQCEDRGKAEYVSEAVTRDKYPLVICTRFNIPVLLNECGTGHVSTSSHCHGYTST